MLPKFGVPNPREEQEVGRYQCPHVLGSEELQDLLRRYRDYLEQDGRHAPWISSPQGEGTLVYDHTTSSCRRVLDRRSFVESEVRFPAPHVHWYHSAFDAIEEQLFQEFDWLPFPLRDGDIY